jgi:hypothetical protein
MTEPILPPDEGASPTAVVEKPIKVGLSEWALAILLTMLIGLSTAALLSASIMEMMFDSASAWIRIFVLLPVLGISAYLLVQLWKKLFDRRDATKK